MARTSGKGEQNQFVHGIDEEGVEDAGAEFAQPPGDVYICALEEVCEVGAGRTGANILDDLPPELGDLDSGRSISTLHRHSTQRRSS